MLNVCRVADYRKELIHINKANRNSRVVKFNNKKKNWTRIKMLGKTYRVNPVAENIYRTVGECFLGSLLILSVAVMYLALV